MSQITKKFIADNAVDGAKLRLLNNQMLRGRNAAGTADVDILKVTTGDVVEFQQLPQAAASLPIPSAPKEFATIEYIENVIAGKNDAKDAVNAIADSDTALAGAGALVVDGVNFGTVTATPKKRVLLTNQSNAAENGIYEYSYAAGNYSLVRSADANTNAEVTHGMYCLATGGTVYAGYEAILTTDDPINLGVTPLTFAKYPSTLSITAGDMLTKTGNDFTVDLAAVSGLESTNPGNASGQLRARVDQAALEKDKSTKLDAGSNAILAKKAKREVFTLSSTDITNQYVDLLNVAGDGSVQFGVAGAGEQVEGTDFTVNYTGGSGSKTRVTFAGGLATGGVSELVAGDVVQVSYSAF